MSRYYDYKIGDFRKDMRVELHPATDLWMAGARYGTVMAVGVTKVHVQLDLARGIHRIAPNLLRPITPIAELVATPTITERLTTHGRGYTTAGQVIEELKRCELFEDYADAGATYVGSGDAATFKCDLDDDGYEFIVTVIRVQKDYTDYDSPGRNGEDTNPEDKKLEDQPGPDEQETGLHRPSSHP